MLGRGRDRGSGTGPSAGDVIVLPYGDDHRMGGTNDAELVSAASLVTPPPWSEMPVISYGEGGDATEVVCGYLVSDDPLFDPGLRALPPVFVVSPPTPAAQPFVARQHRLRAAADLPGRGRPGRRCRPRCPQLLLAEVLRIHLASAPPLAARLAARAARPRPRAGDGRAARRPGRASGRCAELAAAALVSASSLDQRFRDVLGDAADPLPHRVADAPAPARCCRAPSWPSAPWRAGSATTPRRRSAAPSSVPTAWPRHDGGKRAPVVAPARSYPAPVYAGDGGEPTAWFRPADTPPELPRPGGGAASYLATGATTGGRFGPHRWDMGPMATGASPHFHRTITESFFVLAGVVSLYDGGRWRDAGPGDFAHVPEGGLHGFRNDSGAPASMLILFTPGAPRRPTPGPGRHRRRPVGPLPAGAAGLPRGARQLLRLTAGRDRPPSVCVPRPVGTDTPHPDPPRRRTMQIGRLAARAVIGGLFVGHGTQKLFGWFGGPRPRRHRADDGGPRKRPTRPNALAAGVTEAAGGALLVAGAATPLAASSLIGTMLTAIRKVHQPNGPWVTNGGWEYNAVLIAALTALVDGGPGDVSVDALAGRKEWLRARRPSTASSTFFCVANLSTSPSLILGDSRTARATILVPSRISSDRSSFEPFMAS